MGPKIDINETLRAEWTKANVFAQGRRPPASGSVVHFSLPSPEWNAGDSTLFPLTRAAIGRDIKWRMRNLRRPVEPKLIEGISGRCRGVVVGGGGLFLKDTVPDSRSGWQWNISPDSIRRLDVPVVLFAVGYNRFEGQEEWGPEFYESLEALADVNAWVGLRNRGSIRALKKCCPRLQPVLQPCPTTFMPSRLGLSKAPWYGGRPLRVALSIGVDRAALRYGGDPPSDGLKHLVKRLSLDGHTVHVLSHSPEDGRWARQALPGTKVVSLWGCRADAVLRAWATYDVAVAGRGHSQMIPFGLGVPVITLASHPKHTFFAEDAGLQDWLVPHQPGWEKRVYSLIDELAEPEVWMKQSSAILEKTIQLNELSEKNIAHVRRLFGIAGNGPVAR